MTTPNDPRLPALTVREIALIRDSFAVVITHRDDFAQALYVRLFQSDPNVALLFHGDQAAQQDKFARMMVAAVDGLDEIERIAPLLARLGQRHQIYGVRKKDYWVFWEALEWTLEKLLGDTFTPATRAAWSRFYVLLTRLMLNAYEAVAPPATAHRAR